MRTMEPCDRPQARIGRLKWKTNSRDSVIADDMWLSNTYGQFKVATTNPVGRHSRIGSALARNGSDLACLVGQTRRSMADASERHSD
jgi:hypothetical protein